MGNGSGVVPPGDGPDDPAVKDIDAVAFALERAQTHLHWCEEHRSHFEAARACDPDTAERELRHLADSTREARRHLARLAELLLAGYAINPAKRLPQGLRRHVGPRPP